MLRSPSPLSPAKTTFQGIGDTNCFSIRVLCPWALSVHPTSEAKDKTGLGGKRWPQEEARLSLLHVFALMSEGHSLTFLG